MVNSIIKIISEKSIKCSNQLDSLHTLNYCLCKVNFCCAELSCTNSKLKMQRKSELLQPKKKSSYTATDQLKYVSSDPFTALALA